MRSPRAAEADARSVAIRVLSRVTTEGAFAGVTLDGELRRAGLDARDARLASAIVYGALRSLDGLDAIIAARLDRAKKLDPFVRNVLRAAVFQLAGLDRQPAHAVLDHAVSFVRAERGAQVAGFVNAVLRRIARESVQLEMRTSLDPAVAARLVASVGEVVADALLAPVVVPPIDLRVVRADRDAVLARLVAEGPAGAEFGPTPFSPRGIRTRRAGDPRALPGFEDGAFVVQDEGSQLVAALVRARPGERVLDACAGRGGKTLALAESVGASGRVVAVDLHEARLAQIVPAALRLGLEAALETHAVDLTVGAGGIDETFDAVLVDAPCSGLGTLRRRPEIGLRLTLDGIAELAALQRAVLSRAAERVRPGGRLVYAVCSPLDEEGRDVVSGLDPERFTAHPFDDDESTGLVVAADGSLLLGPSTALGADMDAYRVFRFHRV